VEIGPFHQQGAGTTPLSHCAGGRDTIITLVWALAQRRPLATPILTTAAVPIVIFSSPRDASKANIVNAATGKWRGRQLPPNRSADGASLLVKNIVSVLRYMLPAGSDVPMAWDVEAWGRRWQIESASDRHRDSTGIRSRRLNENNATAEELFEKTPWWTQRTTLRVLCELSEALEIREGWQRFQKERRYCLRFANPSEKYTSYYARFTLL